MPGRTRLSTASLGVVCGAVAAFLLTMVDASVRRGAESEQRDGRSELAARLQLTDLSLFTEARYTRHPSLADLHSAFQDHPAALDHFPSAAWMPPRPWTGGRP